MTTQERIIRLELLIKLQKSIVKIFEEAYEDIKNDVEYNGLKETIGEVATDMVKDVNNMLKNIAGGNNG